MKKIIPKIKLNKKDLIKILAKCAGYKRLLLIVFFGMLLIFTVDVVYKYAFLNIKYINYYVEDNSFIITNGEINNVNLSRVLKNIDEDKEKIKMEINKEYETPFSFSDPEPLNESEEDKKENIDSDNLDYEPES